MLKKLKEILLGKDLVVYELRKFLRKLYEGYPTHAFFDYEKGGSLEAGMNLLLKDNIIESVWKEKENKYGFILRVEGLKLVETWNIEKLTLWGTILSLTILLLTIDGLYIASLGIPK